MKHGVRYFMKRQASSVAVFPAVGVRETPENEPKLSVERQSAGLTVAVFSPDGTSRSLLRDCLEQTGLVRSLHQWGLSADVYASRSMICQGL